MSAFLDRLLAQSRPGHSAPVAPRMPGRFETAAHGPDGLEESEEFVERSFDAPRPVPSSSPSPLADDPLAQIPALHGARITSPEAGNMEKRVVIERQVETRMTQDASISPEVAHSPAPAVIMPAPMTQHATPKPTASLPTAREAGRDSPSPFAEPVDRTMQPAALPVSIAPSVIESAAPLTPAPPPPMAPPPSLAPHAMETGAPRPAARSTQAAPVVRIHIGRIEIEAAADPFEGMRPRERSGERARDAAAQPSPLDRYLRRN